MTNDIDALVLRWREAERRLYPLILSDLDLYEHCVLLVRAVADQLGDAPSVEELADLFDRATELVLVTATRLGIPMEEVEEANTATIAGAAFSLRHTELLQLAPVQGTD
jgi:hypothetical protein